MKAPRYVASFDSSTAMLRALARYLHGRDFPSLGLYAFSLYPAMAVNWLPRVALEAVYSWSGWYQAFPGDRLDQVSAEEVAAWMVDQYPRRSYPAVMVGSSNGAALHLGAALGIPWLPQTFLIPVRRPPLDPDEPWDDVKWAREPAAALLAANPDLQLHHMHDPSDDRLMIRYMTYFRVKRLRLGPTFERFMTECLEPGGTILVLDCQLRWPTTRMGERHIFQPGAPGGVTPKEFVHGGPRVKDFLARHGSRHEAWRYPAPDGERPEAEWGFEPALLSDIEAFASRHGFRVQRLVYREPEDLSALVADFYRGWHARRGIPARRLVAESFIVLEPWWVLRTGSVPFWLKFPMEPSAQILERYLDGVPEYDHVHVMLFSNGIESLGMAPVSRWRQLMARGRKAGGFIGVDEAKFPRDFATFVRYHTDMRRIPERYPMPAPLSLQVVEEFLTELGPAYGARLTEQPAALRRRQA